MSLREDMGGVVKNTTALVIQQAITMTSGFVLLLFMPRYLGPQEYGRYFLGTSIVTGFLVIVNYGSNLHIAKLVSRSKGQTSQILADSLTLRAVLAGLCAVGVVGLAGAMGYSPEQNEVLYILSFGLFTWGAYSAMHACYQGHQLLHFASYAAVTEKLFITVAAIGALMLGVGASGVALIVVIGSVIGGWVMYSMLGRIGWVPVRPSLARAAVMLSEGLPYFLYTVFGTIYYRINAVMLSKMTDEAAVGNYGAAQRLFETMNIPYFLSLAVYPLLSRLWETRPDAHERVIQRSLEVVVLAGIPGMIGAWVFAHDAILFFGGEKYGDAGLILQVLSLGMIFLYVDMILGPALIASDRQRAMMILALVSIPVSVALNYYFIGYFRDTMGKGAVGAAVATSIVEFALMIAGVIMLPAARKGRFFLMPLSKGIPAGVVMSLFLYLTAGLEPWLLRAVISVIIYGVVLWLMKPFSVEERDLLTEQIRSRLRIRNPWKRKNGRE